MVIRNYVGYDFNAFDVSGIQSCNNSKVNYYVQFGEIYDVSGTPTIYSNLASFGSSGTPKTSSNAIFDFLDWSKTAYISLDIDGGGYASYRTLNQQTFREKLRKDEQKFLTFFDRYGWLRYIYIELQNSLGGYIDSSIAGYDETFGIKSVNIAKAGDAYGHYKDVYDSAFTDPNVKFLVVRGLDVDENPLFETIFDIDNSCTKYESVRLHWLNNLGAFDSFTFMKVSRNRNDARARICTAALFHAESAALSVLSLEEGADERVFAGTQDQSHVTREVVAVLLKETGGLVDDLAGVVGD